MIIPVIILGLISGAVINVLIKRIPEENPALRKSNLCSLCGAKQKTTDLIPVVSYLYYKGKCRYCNANISLRSPFVEILTVVCFYILYSKFGASIEFALTAWLVSILITIVFIDLDHYIIPNGLVLSAIAGGAALFFINLFAPVKMFYSKGTFQPLLGMIPGTAFLLLIFIIGIIIYKSDDAMGMGDVKLFAPVGMYLGWQLCILALLLSIIGGGILSITLIATGIKKRKDVIPFGPFIALGVFVALIWGIDIIKWYLG